MKKELSFVLNYALNKGFQIHPDAFKILDDITDVKKLEKIIKEIVKEKTRQKLFQINQDDLETYLGIKDDPNLLNEMKILSDPTDKITSGEGGMICCKEKSDYEIIKSLRSHGWSRGLTNEKKISKTHRKIDSKFVFYNSGYNLRPTDIAAAIGCNQFKRLNKFINIRKQNRKKIILNRNFYLSIITLALVNPLFV